MIHAATLFVTGSIIKPADAGKTDGRCAHGAGFQRDIEIATDQSLTAQQSGRLADCQHFRMGCRVTQLQSTIAGSGDYLTG